MKLCGTCGKDMSSLPNLKRRKSCSEACMREAQKYSPEEGVIAFWKKVEKTPSCWLYKGFRKWDGYGWLSRLIEGKRRYLTAHRYAWMLTKGEPAEGMHVLHKCDVPACCNPDHLWLGTHEQNMADMVSKGRENSGGLKKYKPVLYPDRVRPRRAA